MKRFCIVFCLLLALFAWAGWMLHVGVLLPDIFSSMEWIWTKKIALFACAIVLTAMPSAAMATMWENYAERRSTFTPVEENVKLLSYFVMFSTATIFVFIIAFATKSGGDNLWLYLG